MPASKGETIVTQVVNFDPPITAQRLVRLVDVVADPAAGEIAILPTPDEPFVLGEYSTLPSRDIRIEARPPLSKGWQGSKISQIAISSTDWEPIDSNRGTGSNDNQERLNSVNEYAAYLIKIYNEDFYGFPQ